jgi:hypothetical protein
VHVCCVISTVLHLSCTEGSQLCLNKLQVWVQVAGLPVSGHRLCKTDWHAGCTHCLGLIHDCNENCYRTPVGGLRPSCNSQDQLLSCVCNVVSCCLPCACAISWLRLHACSSDTRLSLSAVVAAACAWVFASRVCVCVCQPAWALARRFAAATISAVPRESVKMAHVSTRMDRQHPAW